MSLLDEMEGYLQECSNLPFSSKVVVNMEVLYEFMADLRMKLPEEIKRSKRIVDEKDKILQEAKMTAKQIDEETKEHVRILLDEHEIKRQAVNEAEDILKRAKDTANEITEGAYQYVEDILIQNKQVIEGLLEQTTYQSSQYTNYLRSQVDVLERNRSSIKKPE